MTRAIATVYGSLLSSIVIIFFRKLNIRYGPLVCAWSLWLVRFAMPSTEASGAVREVGLSKKTYIVGMKKGVSLMR